MNIDVTALQTVPELQAAPGGLRPKKCKTATIRACGPSGKSCEITHIWVALSGNGGDFG